MTSFRQINRKQTKNRVTFFGTEAETLVDLRVAQVVEAEKDMHITSIVCVCLCVCACVCVCVSACVSVCVSVSVSLVLFLCRCLFAFCCVVLCR